MTGLLVSTGIMLRLMLALGLLVGLAAGIGFADADAYPAQLLSLAALR